MEPAISGQAATRSENPFTLAFWFGDVDPRPLALFRVGFGLCVLQDLFASYFVNATDWLTEEGMLPRGVQGDPFAWSLLDWVGSSAGVFAFLLIGAALLIGYTVGLRPRWMAAGCWVFLTSLHNRNLYVVDGGDDLVRYLFFYSVFADMGGAYSLDIRLGLRKPGPVPALGLRFLQANVAFLYFVTARLKFRANWLHKNAIHLALQLNGFVRPPGTLLLGFPQLCRLLTYSVAFLEASFPWLAFSPIWIRKTRALAIIAALLVQGGILVSMRVGIFTGVMLACNALWLQPEWLDWLETKLRARRGLPPAPRPDAAAVASGTTTRNGKLVIAPARIALCALLGLQLFGEAWAPMMGSRVHMPKAWVDLRHYLATSQPYDLFGTTYDVPRWKARITLADRAEPIDVLPEVVNAMLGEPGWRFSRWYKFLFKWGERPYRSPELGRWMLRRYQEKHPEAKVQTFSILQGLEPPMIVGETTGPTQWKEIWHFDASEPPLTSTY